MYLPLANLLHYKLRSFLSAVGIGIGICMLVTLSGLSRGSLYEVADRWESVDADLFAYPEIWEGNITSLTGVGVPDRWGEKILRDHPQLVERVIPVFLWQVRLVGQFQLVAGIDPKDFTAVTGGRDLTAGRLFDPDDRFANWIEDRLLAPPEDDDEPAVTITPVDLLAPEHNGMEIVIDTRLAQAGGLKLGQTVEIAGNAFAIVGIVPAGGMTRILMPRRTAQYLFGSGDITKSTLLFIKLKRGVEANSAARRIAGLGLEIVQLRQFRGMLENQFAIMFSYVDAVNAVVMLIAFLFIMITLYTMVLQRTRDIAILKSSGASNAFIVRQVMGESLLLTAGGTLLGIAASFAARPIIERFRPLLTVVITPRWILTALAVALLGALLSALYPAWRAARVDMVEALSWE